MKISLSETGETVIKELYNGATLITNSNEKISICMRDSGFEFKYNEKWYQAKKGKISPLSQGEITTLNDINDDTIEGKLLLAALVILTTENFTNNTPDQVIDRLTKISSTMYDGNHKVNVYYAKNGETCGESTKEHLVGQLKMWPESSQVYSTDYDVLGKRLVVVFKSNMKAYEYNHFPLEKYEELLKCESIGSYINKEVKGKFNYRAIEAEETIASHPPINTPDL